MSLKIYLCIKVKLSSGIFEMEQMDKKIVNRFLNSIENRYYNNIIVQITLILVAVVTYGFCTFFGLQAFFSNISYQ